VNKPTLMHDAENITPEWMTDVLNYAGVIGRVDSMTTKSIGTGQVGENVRFVLDGQGDLPSSVVGKFASTDPVSKQTGIALQNYVKEVFFYNEIASSVDIQTPEVYYADIIQETHDFAIIMQDLAPGVPGDQIQGCTVDQAALALEQLAKLHGPRWGDNSLQKHDLLAPKDLAEPDPTKSIYQMVQSGFTERYNNRLSSTDHQMVKNVGENIANYVNFNGEKTLIHIDYRLDNMMFGGPYPLAVVDWQSISLGCAFNDVSYFMGTSLTPDDRATNEEALLKLYLDALKPYGIDMKWNAAWDLYRHYAPAGLIMAVIASMIVGETDRGNSMFMAMATRSAIMSEELQSIDLLSNN
jgi:hypothetical protein